MKAKKLLFVLTLLFSISTFAQSKLPNKPYISGGFGTAEFSRNPANNDQNTFSLLFGIGGGIPVYKNLSLYTKISYQKEDNFTAYFVNSYGDNIQITNELTQLNASFSRLIFNFGLQFYFPIAENWFLGFNSGVLYSLINQEAFLTSGELYSKLNNEGTFGYFGGASLEKHIEDSDFSVYGEAQYNYADNNAIFFRKAFDGMNYMFGVRYYLSGR